MNYFIYLFIYYDFGKSTQVSECGDEYKCQGKSIKGSETPYKIDHPTNSYI